jgi:ABC-2 type transport system ATP-binding protein
MAHAMLHDPDVLILDEPTSGLDPNQVHGVRELILELAKTKTVLLSTHILQEVRAVCDRVLLINNGKVVFDGSTTDLGQNEVEMEAQFRRRTLASAS